MKPKEDIELLIVKPENYDRIIELSKTTQVEPYSIEQLQEMEEEARSKNGILTIAFYTLDYWKVRE